MRVFKMGGLLCYGHDGTAGSAGRTESRRTCERAAAGPLNGTQPRSGRIFKYARANYAPLRTLSCWRWRADVLPMPPVGAADDFTRVNRFHIRTMSDQDILPLFTAVSYCRMLSLGCQCCKVRTQRAQTATTAAPSKAPTISRRAARHGATVQPLESKEREPNNKPQKTTPEGSNFPQYSCDPRHCNSRSRFHRCDSPRPTMDSFFMSKPDAAVP